MPTFYSIRKLGVLLLFSWICACTPADDSGYYKKEAPDTVADPDSLPLLFYDTTWLQQTVAQQRDLLRLSQEAQSQASSAPIRRLAQVLQGEHAAVLREAEQLAAAKNWNFPADSTRSEEPGGVQGLRAVLPGSWDQKWLRLVSHRQEELTERLEASAAQVGDGDLRAWILHTVPRMRRLHTELARVRDSVKQTL